MKRFLLLLLFMTFAAMAFAAQSVDLKFDYTFNLPVCSTTITTNCIDHFEALDVTGANSILFFSVPAPAGASGTVSGITGKGPALAIVPLGTRTLSVIAVAKDASGARITSDPNAASVSSVVRPGDTVNVNVTVKQ
jgi:hypothetical protein